MSDHVTTTMGMSFKAIRVPNFVKLIAPGLDEADGPSIAISVLTPDAVDALAKQWLDHLYAQIERPNPFRHIGPLKGEPAR